jgi:hypothetical protein
MKSSLDPDDDAYPQFPMVAVIDDTEPYDRGM